MYNYVCNHIFIIPKNSLQSKNRWLLSTDIHLLVVSQNFLYLFYNYQISQKLCDPGKEKRFVEIKLQEGILD